MKYSGAELILGKDDLESLEAKVRTINTTNFLIDQNLRKAAEAVKRSKACAYRLDVVALALDDYQYLSELLLIAVLWL